VELRGFLEKVARFSREFRIIFILEFPWTKPTARGPRWPSAHGGPETEQGGGARALGRSGALGLVVRTQGV
jgi:hypothetical protein